MAKVATGRIIIENRSLSQGAPLISIGVPLVKNKLGQVTHIGVANINFFAIQKAFAAKSERTIFLVSPQGEVLAHPDEKLALSGVSLKSLPIVEKAINAPLKQGQLRYQDKKQKEYFIAAFSRLAFDLAVISSAPESLILEPAKRVQREVIYITGVALFAAFFVIFLFSSTLTRPIELLVGLTNEIAKGNFKISARRIIHSKDEVGLLAFAFDHMTTGLQERDKVKNMFVKFHGSSITEDILTGQDLSKLGSNREVCVFFSDIRGFTAFSESRPAEEVVTMLNEYFSRMVTIINQNHGVVDKFIGDAIMAIWGAPKSTGDDAYHAVKAALLMRSAVYKLNEERIARGEVPIKIGMGVHIGRAISGTIGSEERMEYTVIGDTVNMASRIEASTKAFGVDLLLSEPIAERVKERFVLELGGEAKVKGKSSSLKMFKVLGYRGDDGTQQIVKTPYSDYVAEGAAKVEVI